MQWYHITFAIFAIAVVAVVAVIVYVVHVAGTEDLFDYPDEQERKQDDGRF
jgi:hypothetical protein